MGFEEELGQWLSAQGISDADRVLAVPVCARTPGQAYERMLSTPYGRGEHIMVVEDRWRRDAEAVKTRVLSHLRVFTQVYARNCELRRIDKPAAAAFLEQAHSYGDAACRFRYGLFLKRLTGEKSTSLPSAAPSSDFPPLCSAASTVASSAASSAFSSTFSFSDSSRAPVSSSVLESVLEPGTLVAVAEFSAARRWKKGDRTVSSYEWVRYASLPGIRVVGGMGKLLKAFIRDQKPDDIMTYADLEWSCGDVYRQLGFVEEGRREPVLFAVSPVDWKRTPLRSGIPGSAAASDGTPLRSGISGSAAPDDNSLGSSIPGSAAASDGTPLSCSVQGSAVAPLHPGISGSTISSDASPLRSDIPGSASCGVPGDSEAHGELQAQVQPADPSLLYHCSPGSVKFRLKLKRSESQ